MHVVGSVIAIQDNKFIVCGYRPVDMGDSVSMGYLLVPYPLGFVGMDSFSLVSADTDFPIVHEGYRNEDATAYDSLLEQIRVMGRDVTMDEVMAVADEARAEFEADLEAMESEGE